jgi:hypothetical protein
MARAAVQFLRGGDGEWRAAGVWLATRASLQSRFDPAAGLGDFVKRTHDFARPPSTEPGGPPGTWEDWVEYALDALSNGHDLAVVETEPEPTVDELYAREVLKLPRARVRGFALKGVPNVTTIELPDLAGRPARRA